MNIMLFFIVIMVAILAWFLNNYVEPSVYACSQVTKQDPIEVQRLCAQEKRNKSWMK